MCTNSPSASGEPAPCRLPLGMSNDDEPCIQKLLKDLRSKRVQSLESTDPIKQTDVAESMGVDPTFVSRLERGTRSLRSLSGDQVWKFLSGYRYDALLIKSVVEECNLNRPPQLFETGGSVPSGMVDVLYEGSISRHETPRPRGIPVEFVSDFDANALRLRGVEASDYVTGRVRDRVNLGSLLVLHPKLKPTRGKPVIIRQGSIECLTVWPLEEAEYAMPFNPTGTAKPVVLEPGKVEVVAVVVGAYNRF